MHMQVGGWMGDLGRRVDGFFGFRYKSFEKRKTPYRRIFFLLVVPVMVWHTLRAFFLPTPRSCVPLHWTSTPITAFCLFGPPCFVSWISFCPTSIHVYAMRQRCKGCSLFRATASNPLHANLYKVHKRILLARKMGGSLDVTTQAKSHTPFAMQLPSPRTSASSCIPRSHRGNIPLANSPSNGVWG